MNVKLFDDIKNFLIVKKIIPKFICIILAMVLWVFVGSQNNDEKIIKSEIEFTNLAPNLAIAGTEFNSVNIIVKGRKELLPELSNKNFKTIVNLDNVTGSVYNQKYTIKLVTFDVPEELQIKLSSKKVFISIDNKINKRIKIIPQVSALPVENFYVGNIAIKPLYIQVSGPESQLKGLDYINTKPFSVANLNASLLKELPIDKDNLPNIKIDIKGVIANIPVSPIGDYIVVKKKLNIKNIQNGLIYEPSNQEITLIVSIPSGNKIIPESWETFIDVTNSHLESGVGSLTKEFPVNLLQQPPVDGAQIVEIVPETVFVNIKQP